MAKKTNKTSHVMDLLTNGASGEANDSAGETAASPEGAAGQEKKGDVQSHTVSPKKVTVVDEGSRNDRLSQEILNKLSEELESDVSGQTSGEESTAPAAQAADAATAPMETPSDQSFEPAPEAAEPAGETLPAEEESTAEDALVTDTNNDSTDTLSAPEMTETAPEPAPVASSTKDVLPSIMPKSKLNERLNHDDYHFVNVMELLLLRQDLDSYLEQYGVCKCERCLADVCALVLTGLPAKYVVARKDSVSPILGYSENKYKIYMLTELIKACNKVREHPRHSI